MVGLGKGINVTIEMFPESEKRGWSTGFSCNLCPGLPDPLSKMVEGQLIGEKGY
jgi:hypothetical protein